MIDDLSLNTEERALIQRYRATVAAESDDRAVLEAILPRAKSHQERRWLELMIRARGGDVQLSDPSIASEITRGVSDCPASDARGLVMTRDARDQATAEGRSVKIVGQTAPSTEVAAGALDPALCKRLAAECREDDGRMLQLEGSESVPWRAVEATGQRFRGNRLRHYVTCISADHACWSGDDLVSWSRLGIWTSEGVTERTFAEAIARSRNNLAAIVAQLTAAADMSALLQAAGERIALLEGECRRLAKVPRCPGEGAAVTSPSPADVVDRPSIAELQRLQPYGDAEHRVRLIAATPVLLEIVASTLAWEAAEGAMSSEVSDEEVAARRLAMRATLAKVRP